MTQDQFISIWGSKSALARAMGEKETTVRQWFLRGSIPHRYDKQIFDAAEAVGRKLTHEDMFQLREEISIGSENAA